MDEHYQTSVPGVFAAGNVLHVHDLVDFVSQEAEALALAVGRYLTEEGFAEGTREIACGRGVRYTVPQRITGKEEFTLSLRVAAPMKDVTVVVRQGDAVIGKKKMKKALPAEMIRMKVSPVEGDGELEVRVDD